MNSDKTPQPQPPRMVSYIIAPPVRQAIEQQTEPAPIPVIICLVESKEHPELGLGPAKDRVKEALSGLSYNPRLRESDFYLQTNPLDGCPSGIAPLAKLVNVKVLNDDGAGSASTTILGLEYVRKINQGSREIRIDGVNLSLGHPFDPKWYGCGHSPLCREVDRAVDAGLIVVVSCGNSGYGTARLDTGQQVPIYIDLSINDPANAAGAFSVGSAHKSAPHRYGISYFSSKGPTGDGRLKPDIVAPGEKIVSCSLSFDASAPQASREYEERSGTSMAAPHVSGAIAAFLSVHKGFRGDPRRVKEIFMKTATDMLRDRCFQGAGLIDLLGAMMAV